MQRMILKDIFIFLHEIEISGSFSHIFVNSAEDKLDISVFFNAVYIISDDIIQTSAYYT